MSENLGATPDVEEVAIPEVAAEQPKSMDDTIRETLRSLRDNGVNHEVESLEAKEEKSQRVRDENGKFKAKEEVAGNELTPEPEPAQEIITKPAPNTWKKEAQEKWATLPPEVQAEVERREADFHKGIEQYRSKAQFADSIERVLTPHMATLQGLNVTPDVAIGELLNSDRILRYGSPQDKQSAFFRLASYYGVDVSNIQNFTPPQIDPQVSALQQKFQQLEGIINQQKTLDQQREAQALNSELEAFKADPAHRHFEAVRNDMADLLQGGVASSLKDAYEQAVWRNPITRAALIAEQQKAQRDEANRKAKEAKEASSVNVRSRPSLPTSQPIGSMEDTIRATLRKLQGQA